MASGTDVVVVEHATVAENNACCKNKGPGYGSPLQAMAGPREKLLYVTCIYTGKIPICPLFSLSPFFGLV